MKPQDIKTLELIESLERDPGQTQRVLAKELNISLGLVNSFLKRLIQKGYFKITTIPKNRIKYMLTPEGMYEKTRLTYQYILYSLDFYKETRAKIKSILNQLSQQGKGKIHIIGANELTEIAIISLQESNLELAGVIDSEKIGEKILGTIIKDFSSLNNLSSADIVIIASTTDESLGSRLQSNYPEVKILDLRQ